MPYSLSELVIYPIKSIKGISLEASHVDKAGLRGDRRYMLVEPNGKCMTARTHPELTLVKAKPLQRGAWRLSHPATRSDYILDPAAFPDKYEGVVVWDNTVNGQRVLEGADVWFSDIVDENVKLIYFGDKSERYTSRRPESPVAFADGYPFLLTTRASLLELNRTCPEQIEMAQFRPNLVIRGGAPFEEDRWKRLKIGDVEFENIKPCIRCIFTTLNPTTAERMPKGEPLKTLGKFRLLDNKGITFGINMIALNTGKIHIDDTVEILEYKEPDCYLDRRTK